MFISSNRRLRAGVALLSLLGFASVLAGCETWKGFGRDVEHLGDNMQGDDSDHSQDDRDDADE